MIRTIEAIELTIGLAESARDENLEDGYLEFAMDQTARRISMHAEHMENTIIALETKAKQLQRDIDKLIANG